MAAQLVSIIGPPGSGKTTLAEKLAEKLSADLIYEDYRGNPFLAGAYTGCDAARLPAQLYYLMSRISQLSRLNWPKEGLVVSDYGFCQDRIYARIQLEDSDFELYEKLQNRLRPLVQSPALVILLDADPATLLKRIAERGRLFERVFNESFLQSMRDAYLEVPDRIESPVLNIRCDEVDFRREKPLEDVLQQVREYV